MPPCSCRNVERLVSRILFRLATAGIIHLPLALPRWSSNLPGGSYGNGRFHCLPIWSCSAGGLPCRPAHAVRGALLPHRFTLASSALACARAAIGGLFSVALSVASPRLAVSQ